VHRLILAAIDPANTPHGYNWTFAFPMLLFIVIAVILYALFSRPHHRVPARRISLGTAASAPGAATVSGSAAPSAGESSKGAADKSGEQPADADTPDGPETSA
jgi:hypothetical protein